MRIRVEVEHRGVIAEGRYVTDRANLLPQRCATLLERYILDAFGAKPEPAPPAEKSGPPPAADEG